MSPLPLAAAPQVTATNDPDAATHGVELARFGTPSSASRRNRSWSHEPGERYVRVSIFIVSRLIRVSSVAQNRSRGPNWNERGSPTAVIWL